MVYRGKLSKACLQCRRRKLRCDLKRESCGQCIRACLPCTGYRDTDQLRIRDESQSIREKALSKSIPPSLTVTIDDQARNAFFTYYVLGFAKSYDVLELLYSRSSLDKHLAASVDAASLAFFSSQFQCAEASNLGWNRYLSALPLLNVALQSTDTAKTDSTLLSTLLLDLFEKTTSTAPRSRESWMGHVQGGMALVNMRDKSQLHSHIGFRLAVRLSTNMLISCVTSDTPVPPALVELRNAIEPLFQADPKWKVSGLVIEYLSIRSIFKEGILAPSELISLALQLDNKFISLAKTMPPSWRYETIVVDGLPVDVLDSHFDRYLDRFITQSWNVLRTMRILLNDMIFAVATDASADDDFFTIVSTNSSTEIESMAREVCASAPQYLTRPDYLTANKKDLAADRMQCYTLIFPLYVAGMYTKKHEVKQWVQERLEYICKAMGVPKARVVSEMLETRVKANPWEIYTILGSYAFAA